MSDEFIREVDEDIRQRQINDLWKKYGKFVIGIAFGIVAIVAGRAIYSSVIESKYSEQASLYSQAISMNENEISSALDPLLNGDVQAYEILATFKKSKLALENGINIYIFTSNSICITNHKIQKYYGIRSVTSRQS